MLLHALLCRKMDVDWIQRVSNIVIELREKFCIATAFWDAKRDGLVSVQL